MKLWNVKLAYEVREKLRGFIMQNEKLGRSKRCKVGLRSWNRKFEWSERFDKGRQGEKQWSWLGKWSEKATLIKVRWVKIYVKMKWTEGK